MKEENPQPAEDIYNLVVAANTALLFENNFLEILNDELKKIEECARIIEQYEFISRLMSAGGLGPGNFELQAVLYFWQLVLGQYNVFTKLDNLQNDLIRIEQKVDDVKSFLNIEIINRLDTLSSYQQQTTVQVIAVPQQVEDRVKVLLKNALKTQANEVSEQVCAKIVGQTYYRWDSDVSYYPSLVFLFEEDVLQLSRRRTQIKTRLKYTTEQLPQDIIEILTGRLRSRAPLTYKRGDLRANFVESTKRWRTTFNVTTRVQALRVLRYIAFISDFPFIPENLSITTRRKKPEYSRLSRDLIGVKHRERFIEGEYDVKLFRVVLLINNAEGPTVIWKSR